jgi:hypothetical protein
MSVCLASNAFMTVVTRPRTPNSSGESSRPVAQGAHRESALALVLHVPTDRTRPQRTLCSSSRSPPTSSEVAGRCCAAHPTPDPRRRSPRVSQTASSRTRAQFQHGVRHALRVAGALGELSRPGARHEGAAPDLERVKLQVEAIWTTSDAMVRSLLPRRANLCTKNLQALGDGSSTPLSAITSPIDDSQVVADEVGIALRLSARTSANCSSSCERPGPRRPG